MTTKPIPGDLVKFESNDEIFVGLLAEMTTDLAVVRVTTDFMTMVYYMGPDDILGKA